MVDRRGSFSEFLQNRQATVILEGMMGSQNFLKMISLLSRYIDSTFLLSSFTHDII